jgi:hypothetical protein
LDFAEDLVQVFEELAPELAVEHAQFFEHIVKIIVK